MQQVLTMYSVGFPPSVLSGQTSNSGQQAAQNASKVNTAMQLFAPAAGSGSQGGMASLLSDRALINQRLQVLMNMSCLRMRGLPFSATMEDIQTFVGSHSRNIVGTVHVIYNLQGRPSGEAVVQLQNPEQAHKCATDLHLKHMGERYIEVFQCCVQDMAWMLATSHANQIAAQQMSCANNSKRFTEKNIQTLLTPQQKASPPPALPLPNPPRTSLSSPTQQAQQQQPKGPSPVSSQASDSASSSSAAPTVTSQPSVRITQAKMERLQLKSSPPPPALPLVRPALPLSTPQTATGFIPATLPPVPIYTAQYPLVTAAPAHAFVPPPIQIPPMPPIMSNSTMFNPESPPFYPVNHFMKPMSGPPITYIAYTNGTALQGPPPVAHAQYIEQGKCGGNITHAQNNGNRYVEMFIA